MTSKMSLSETEDTKTDESLIQEKRADSPEPSCVSMKSDQSMYLPMTFRQRNSSEPPLIQQKRPDSPEPSFVSMKSDQSMYLPMTFRQRYTSEPILIQEKRADSPEPSCVSMKSDQSMYLPMTFRQRNSSEPPVLQTPGDGAEQKTIPTDKECDSALSAGLKIQQKIKFNLIKKFQCLNEVTSNEGSPSFLNEIYTELFITEGDSGEINNEHEVRQIEESARKAVVEDIAIKCNNIFKPLSEQDKSIRTVLTKGVAGIGKTVSVQKFVLDWAEGKANQDIMFMFPLPFRELNLMMDKKLSLLELLHVFFKETKELDMSNLHKVVFIFDGLDECRFHLDFQNTVRLRDVSKPASIDVLLTNLINGNLLPSAFVWITSRPAAADLIPFKWIDQVTEVRGFSDPQKEEYFMKKVSDQRLRSKIITHMKSLRSLYIMCHIPIFCWISTTVLEKKLDEVEGREIPKSLTQMFTHFLIIQTNVIREKYAENQKNDKDILLKLGKLAFQQLEKGNLIFYEDDLRECGIDVREAALYSGVCTQIFREEFGLHLGKVFSFVHLNVQEFLAALFAFIKFINKNTVKKQTTRFSGISKKENMSEFLKSAVDKSLQSKNGHLDLYLRFLLGLSLESNQSLLGDLLPQRARSSHNKWETVMYIKKKLSENLSVVKSLNLLHCLNELNDQSLEQEVQSYLNRGGSNCLNGIDISPAEWAALVFVLLNSEQQLDEFDLSKYQRSEICCLRLLPVIKASRKALLIGCYLSERSCAALSSALSSNTCSLRELNMSQNNLQDSGVKLLSVALQNPNCNLETLRLYQCNLMKKSCAALSSALSSDSSRLRDLNLSYNNLRDSGVKILSTALQNKNCKLEKLRLCECKLTEEGCAALSSVLSSNSSRLRDLNLSYNKLHDSGVTLLSTALQNKNCKLEKLRLRECNLKEEGCAALSSVLSSNSSRLRDLDLSKNELQDSGVKFLSTALQNENCNLEKLRLDQCWIEEEGFDALIKAVRSNPSSHLAELNLKNNYPGDLGKKLVSDLLKDPNSNLEKLDI